MLENIISVLAKFGLKVKIDIERPSVLITLGQEVYHETQEDSQEAHVARSQGQVDSQDSPATSEVDY